MQIFANRPLSHRFVRIDQRKMSWGLSPFDLNCLRLTVSRRLFGFVRQNCFESPAEVNRFVKSLMRMIAIQMKASLG